MLEVRRQENRLFERFQARFPVKFRHARDEYGSSVFLRDASAQGVKVATRQRLFLNDSVSLEVKLPDGHDPLVLNGRVVWIKEKAPELWEAGLEFHRVNLMKLQRMFRLAVQP